ncbi:MAG: response regulator [Proteobacteria bacterium]|nr:response regulator [Pseudomonadota bacterium]
MARILIADDLEQNRYMLEALLGGHGHEVVSAMNGKEALQAARSVAVDLVISDILMPVMDGFTLCREWKRDEDLARIPFIFFTATYTDQKDIDFGLSLGAELFLTKPMEPDRLMEAVAGVLESKGSEEAASEEPPGEAVYLQEYNQALIRKLERKMLQLEDEVKVRREAERRLLRFKTAIENTDDAIILTGADGLVEYVNPAFERTTGYSKDEVLGLEPGFLRGDLQGEESVEGIWEAIRNGRVWRGHLTDKTRAGKTIEMEATVSPIPGEAGEPGGYVSVMRDVTRQVALENQLVQSQKMEAIGTLAGGIAHDFNNILGAIIGYTQLALFDCQEEDKAAHNLNSVLLACDRAKHLVEQILTFSRKTKRERVKVDLVPLIKESQKFLRASIPSTIDIRIHLEVAAGYIQADPVQIQQVILNLCTNSLFAMRDTGGLLEMRLRRTELDEVTTRQHPDLASGTYFVFSITDSGCGMDKETISRIFEPFFTTKDRGEGTGLGLSVAHGIVKGHSGAIVVYSEVGQGTTFNVYFPEAFGPVQAAEKAVPGRLPIGTERILFVDDEQNLVNIGRQMLQKLGYRVTTALSGVEAFEKFKLTSRDFDLVITDQTMRGMTGTELARKIREVRPDIPIVICTGYSTSESEDKFKAAGVSRLMAKPLDFRELAHTVRDILDEL